MIIIAFGDVKSHEVGNVLQIVQALRLRAIPLEPEPVEPESPKLLPATPKLLPAPVVEVPAPAGGVSSVGGNAQCGESRPVQVNVVVNNSSGNGEKRGAEREELALDTIRKNTDLLPGILDKVEATPQRTAALVKDAREGLPGGLASGRERAKKVEAGRERAVVKDKRDRTAIRAEVDRLMAQGFSQKAACEEAADQARNGRAGAHKLTAKYDVGEFEATPTVVRRVYLARW